MHLSSILFLLSSPLSCLLAKHFLVDLGDEMTRNRTNPQAEIGKDETVNYGIEETAMESGFQSELKKGSDYRLSKRELCERCKQWGLCRWCLRCIQWQAQMPVSRAIAKKAHSGGVGMAKVGRPPTRRGRDGGGSRRSSRNVCSPRCKVFNSILSNCRRELTQPAYARKG